MKYRFIDEMSVDKSKRFAQTRGSEQLVFGSHLNQGFGNLVLVEGEFNCMAIYQAMVGFPYDVLSIGGQGNLGYVRTIAGKYSKVLVWMDEQELALKVETDLGNVTQCTALWSERGHDANDWLVKNDAGALCGRIQAALPSAT